MNALFERDHITLENGVRFIQRKGESDKDFKARIKRLVEEDYCVELTIKEHVPENPQLNVGKRCTFLMRTGAKRVSGKIIWVYPDKRKNLLYYRVKGEDGQIYITRVNNKTLKIILV